MGLSITRTPIKLNYVDAGSTITSNVISRLRNTKLPAPKANSASFDIDDNGCLITEADNAVTVFDWGAEDAVEAGDDGDDDTAHGLGLPIIHETGTLDNCHRVLKTLSVTGSKLLLLVETVEERDIRLLVSNEGTVEPLRLKVTHSNFSVRGSTPDAPYALADDNSGSIYVFDRDDRQLASYQASVCNGRCVFDLRGNWLAYSTTHASANTLTRLQLSHRTNLLNKILQGLSSTTVDSFCMFAEISQQKLSKMLNENQPTPKNYRDILVKIYNTLSANSDYVQLVDLTSTTPMFHFVTPEHCSKLSLCPDDMKLATVSQRGDSISLWNFTCYHDHITLVDKFQRGRTFSVIEQILWLPETQSILALSRQNGSLHYFTEDTSQTGWRLSSLGVTAVAFRGGFILALKDLTVLAIDPRSKNSWLFELGEIDASNGSTHNPLASLKSKSATSSQSSSMETDMMDVTQLETCRPFLAPYNDRRLSFAQIDKVPDDLFYFGNCLSIKSTPVVLAKQPTVTFTDSDACAKLGEMTMESEA